MKIQIKERLRPFSHGVGVPCMLPHSPYVLQIFPTLIEVYGWKGEWKRMDTLEIEKSDLVMLDLERGAIQLSGKRWVSFDGANVVVGEKPAARPLLERFSLGDHRKQEIERVRFEGLLPMWFAAGQRLEGKGQVLSVEQMKLCLKVLMKGLFWVEVEDLRHMGEAVGAEFAHPFDLLASAVTTIHWWVERLELPREFPFGKFVGKDLSVDWSKGKLRRLEWRGEEREFVVDSMKRCRVNGEKVMGPDVRVQGPAIIDRFEW